MKVLIVGGKGQLGRGLAATAPADAEIVSHDIDTLDIGDADALRACVSDVKPATLFNAAAYTAVDKAESEEALALVVNGTAVGTLADAARSVGARFIHVSTDFVFDGTSGIPYAPDAAPNPVSAYGRTKLAGEQAAGPDALIVRTAWVYAPTGGNFVRTMLRLMKERPEVRVVADQIGTPTYAPDLARALWTLAARGVTGIHHYTDAGAASWYDFAVAIQEEALAIGLLDKAVPVMPIATSDYPTPARRPHYSVLDKTSAYAALGGPAPHWRSNLRIMLREIARNG
ncbi:dTDP-4-dehydrorhamnose reductase [Blastomonas natatoria]|uniref:dTDP-4-dehydrorhamnose reductase n=1 Tax=Blastomonas natatoria TaxID=34015 RepID=A0A2V3V6D8_9SPHN|nr:dTDP-4-dehydrorhamnose reductase [Blastomonas natatoria]PXW76288.1 dTDP-4-dehydrorhamnose reductase [Blastomonas natatoria]